MSLSSLVTKELGQFERQIIDRQTVRLLDYYEQHKSCDNFDVDISNLRQGLSVLVPSQNLDSILAQVALRLRKGGKLGRHATAAFLTHTHSDLHPHYHKLQLLQAAVLIVSYHLSQKGGYKGAIKRAMNQVRLIVINHYDDELEVLPNFALPPESLLDAMNELWANGSPALKYRIGGIRVLLRYYLKGTAPTRKSALNKEHASGAGFLPRKRSTGRINDELGHQVTEYWDDVPHGLAGAISPLEVAADEGTPERVVTVGFIAPEALQQSLILKNQQARQIMSQMVRRDKRLVTEWGQMTRHEIRRLLGGVLSKAGALNSVVSGYLLMMLITGRTLHDLERLAQGCAGSGFEFINGQWILVYPMDLPKHEVAAANEGLLSRSERQARLLIPSWANNAVKAMCGNSVDMKIIEGLISEMLKTLNKALNTRLTLDRITGYFRFWLVRQGVDVVEISWLHGSEATVLDAGMYYYQCPQQRIQGHFDIYCKHLLSTSVAEDVHEQNKALEPQYIGSQLQLREDVVCRLYSLIRSDCEHLKERALTPADYLGHHNRYLLYSLMVLNLASGHRPVRHPYGSVKQYDAISGLLLIADKASSSNTNERMVMLPSVACQQLNNYTEHLRVLAALVADTMPVLSHQLQASISGQGPLFVVVNESGCKGVTPAWLEVMLTEILPLPLNWHRHFMRSRLRDLDVEAGLVDAWMGHAAFGDEAFHRYSQMSVADLRKISEVVEGYLCGKLAITPLSGLLR